jgi:GNAT superfamily N-acetyltransferase
MELEFGLYAPGDEEQILTLFHQNFPKIPRQKADWQWEYEHNPFGAPIIALAKEGAKVVAQEAFYCVPMKAGEQRVAGAQSIDTMTDAAYRGQGIFKRLALMTLEIGKERQLSLFYGFPNKNSYNGYVNRFGWTDVGRIPR